MNEQEYCTLCGAPGHTAAKCRWNEATEFKREERYLVFKLKDLPPGSIDFLREWAAARQLPDRQCVVVESDWPEYEQVWKMIEARVAAETQPSPKCATCNDNGIVGGPSFYAPDEGGVPCPDCAQPSPAPLERKPYPSRATYPDAAEFNAACGEVSGWNSAVAQHERIVAALRAENERLNTGWFDASRKALSVSLERDAIAAQLDNLAGVNEALYARNGRLAGHLGNLLAVIHRDGGHYKDQHGTTKAVEEAERIVVEQRARLAELKGQQAVPEVTKKVHAALIAARKSLFEVDQPTIQDMTHDEIANRVQEPDGNPWPVAQEGE